MNSEIHGCVKVQTGSSGPMHLGGDPRAEPEQAEGQYLSAVLGMAQDLDRI